MTINSAETPLRYAQFEGLTHPLLLVVVDTEEEFDWSAPFSAEQHSVSSLRRIHLCQSLFERFAVRPTYVVVYPIARREHACRVLRELAEAGRCVIGSQLHPWV